MTKEFSIILSLPKSGVLLLAIFNWKKVSFLAIVCIASLIGFGSFQPCVVSVMSHFGHGSFRPGHFGLGRFGLILGWVVSAYFGGSFRPDIAQTPPPPPTILSSTNVNGFKNNLDRHFQELHGVSMTWSLSP